MIRSFTNLHSGLREQWIVFTLTQSKKLIKNHSVDEVQKIRSYRRETNNTLLQDKYIFFDKRYVTHLFSTESVKNCTGHNSKFQNALVSKQRAILS